jgi:hypothetical protein
MDTLDGELHTIVKHLGVTRILSEHGKIFKSDIWDGLDNLDRFLLKLIKDARTANLNWILSVADIYQDYKDDEETIPEDCWRLPGIELWFCLPDGKSHNDIPKLWKKQNLVETGIIWDTEHSCLYPMFESELAAVIFTGQLNKFIDNLLKLNE